MFSKGAILHIPNKPNVTFRGDLGKVEKKETVESSPKSSFVENFDKIRENVIQGRTIGVSEFFKKFNCCRNNDFGRYELTIQSNPRHFDKNSLEEEKHNTKALLHEQFSHLGLKKSKGHSSGATQAILNGLEKKFNSRPLNLKAMRNQQEIENWLRGNDENNEATNQAFLSKLEVTLNNIKSKDGREFASHLQGDYLVVYTAMPGKTSSANLYEEVKDEEFFENIRMSNIKQKNIQYGEIEDNEFYKNYDEKADADKLREASEKGKDYKFYMTPTGSIKDKEDYIGKFFREAASTLPENLNLRFKITLKNDDTVIGYAEDVKEMKLRQKFANDVNHKIEGQLVDRLSALGRPSTGIDAPDEHESETSILAREIAANVARQNGTVDKNDFLKITAEQINLRADYMEKRGMDPFNRLGFHQSN
jgi:hypothetical protein